MEHFLPHVMQDKTRWSRGGRNTVVGGRPCNSEYFTHGSDVSTGAMEAALDNSLDQGL